MWSYSYSVVLRLRSLKLKFQHNYKVYWEILDYFLDWLKYVIKFSIMWMRCKQAWDSSVPVFLPSMVIVSCEQDNKPWFQPNPPKTSQYSLPLDLIWRFGYLNTKENTYTQIIATIFTSKSIRKNFECIHSHFHWYWSWHLGNKKQRFAERRRKTVPYSVATSSRIKNKVLIGIP